jgi:hypothetical protein
MLGYSTEKTTHKEQRRQLSKQISKIKNNLKHGFSVEQSGGRAAHV